MTSELVKIGYKIRKQRKMLGFSQAELAEMVDIAAKQIHRIECGKCSPSAITLLKIIRALKMDIRILDIENLNNFNPFRDEIYSILSDATDEELFMYRNILNTVKASQRLTTKERQEIKEFAKSKQKELTEKYKK